MRALDPAVAAIFRRRASHWLKTTMRRRESCAEHVAGAVNFFERVRAVTTGNLA